MRLFAVIAAYLALAGCCHNRVVTTTTTDSIRVDVVERIVEVRDTTYIDIPDERVEQTVRDTTSLLTTRYAMSRASVMPDGSLWHSLWSIPQSIPKPITLFVPVTDTTRTQTRIITNIVEVERELTWWQQTQIKGFWAMLAILAIWVLLRRIFS